MIRGLVFVGTRTRADADMTRFAEQVLGLQRRPGEAGPGEAAFYDLADGSTLAVQPVDDEPEEVTVGLLVDDLDAAVRAVHAAGVETDEVSENPKHRYVHLRGPDGRLYELVEERASTVG